MPLLVIVACHNLVNAQVIVKGTVYDRTQLYAMPGVSVLSTSGIGTVTDSSGHYSIKLPTNDSIYFSYLGKSTSKFAVNDITYNLQFDMSLDISMDSLPSVYVSPNNYFMDSLANRKDYQKIFDYGGSRYIDNMKTNRRGGMGVSLDMDMFFNAKESRRLIAFQQRLEQEEHDKYIDHRFTKALVKRITAMEPPALDTFVKMYRPSYDFLKTFTTDWEFYKYILEASRSFMDIWKEEHPQKKAESQ